VNHPTDIKPVVAAGVVLVDDDADWAQQDQDELAEQQAQQDEQQGLLTEQEAQLDVPGS